MPSKRRMPSYWRTLRRAIIERDGGICHLCNLPGANSADHLTPTSQGGTDEASNLKAVHHACNMKRGARPLPRVAPHRSRFDAP